MTFTLFENSKKLQENRLSYNAQVHDSLANLTGKRQKLCLRKAKADNDNDKAATILLSFMNIKTFYE